MAFNPFHGFRKHSKVIFAILTIICMLTFVLAGNFAGGDALDWLVRAVGGSGRRGDVIARQYGKKVYDVELQLLAADRHAANELLQKGVENDLGQALNAAYVLLAKEEKDQEKTTSPEVESQRH